MTQECIPIQFVLELQEPPIIPLIWRPPFLILAGQEEPPQTVEVLGLITSLYVSCLHVSPKALSGAKGSRNYPVQNEAHGMLEDLLDVTFHPRARVHLRLPKVQECAVPSALHPAPCLGLRVLLGLRVQGGEASLILKPYSKP